MNLNCTWKSDFKITYVWKRDLGTTKFFFGANFVSARFGNYKEFWELQMGITKTYQNKKYQLLGGVEVCVGGFGV